MSDTKLTKKEASDILYRLDKMAGEIQSKFASMGLDRNTAKALVNDIDKVADLIEKGAFGEDSFVTRRIEVLKQAKVIQHDSDESYMTTFSNPMKPHQTDADEKYMSAFKDDQSSAVISGKSENGKTLT
jgi:hypothetical protein